MSKSNDLIVIDPQGDLKVRVIQYAFSNRVTSHSQAAVLNEVVMQVSKDKLIAGATYFKTMLAGPFMESESEEIKLEEDTVISVELWLRCLHNALDHKFNTISRKELWEIIAVAKKYGFATHDLASWFEGYWNNVVKKDLDLNDMRSLMFPCQVFHHVNGFAYLTKRLALEACQGYHILDENPTRHHDLHLEGRVIQQLNAVKGTIRNRIIAGVFDCIQPSSFCHIGCAGKKDALWEYNVALVKTGIWPLATVNQKSNKEILESPGFKDWKCEIPKDACKFCRSILEGKHIRDLKRDMENHWQGLCLDCMDTSDTSDSENEYWEQIGDQKIWHKVPGHGMQHFRNTRYHSFMGRAEVMTAFMQQTMVKKKEKAKEDTSKVDMKRKEASEPRSSASGPA